LAGGDFNSKNTLWGSRLTTTKGHELAKVIQAQNYSYLSTGSAIIWPTDANKIPDLLDFFNTNGISATYADVQPSYDLTSDHTPITVIISTIIVVQQPAP
jgi:endonuclease/exonuclease/phosphatase family metal-dependent hydrolase